MATLSQNKQNLMEYKLSFIKSILLLISLVAICWFYQNIFNVIDAEYFLLLNKNVLNNRFSQYFWGLLSHKNESWINVIVMLGINILSILMMHQSIANNKNFNNTKKRVWLVVYCWLSFQVVLLLNIVIFNKILHMHRDSPSIIFAQSIRLSDRLNNINIKDYSNNSFPAGHALVLMYWLLFVNVYASKAIKIISLLIGLLLILSRMITGAHWLSDTVFSLLLGWVYFNLSMWFANSYEQIKNRLY